jgi:hypothetical protein
VRTVPKKGGSNANRKESDTDIVSVSDFDEPAPISKPREIGKQRTVSDVKLDPVNDSDTQKPKKSVSNVNGNESDTDLMSVSDFDELEPEPGPAAATKKESQPPNAVAVKPSSSDVQMLPRDDSNPVSFDSFDADFGLPDSPPRNNDSEKKDSAAAPAPARRSSSATRPSDDDIDIPLDFGSSD